MSGKNGKNSKGSPFPQWPIKIKLVQGGAPFFDGADLLLAVDCSGYVRPDFHSEYMAGKVTLIACSKLEGEDYTDKLTEIIGDNDIKSITLVRLALPCCGGLELAAMAALKNTDKDIPFQIVTLGIDGAIVQ